MIVVLQQGQWELFSSHGSKHLEWNLCAHGRFESVSPFLNDSKHTAQSSCSDAFHLSLLQLNLLLPFFFAPYTSFCNSASLFTFSLLISVFLCVPNLASSLCLASPAAPSSISCGYAWYVRLLCSKDEEERDSWLLVYKQKEERRVEVWGGIKEGVSDHTPLWWNLLLRAHSTPGRFPAIPEISGKPNTRINNSVLQTGHSL